ncbi:hypothetical protein C7271_14400 [filamentous cyanobacterium CCP5]|nr:hypothetical protein C7271_14400 [filamentous cyanobacterium CCP5]
MLVSVKNRKVAAALAVLGALSPVPLTGLHKFYLGQPVWGVVYLLLWWTQIPRIACAVEGVWYLSRRDETFGEPAGFSPQPKPSKVDPAQVGAIATAVRELDRLRQEGLITEQEFEQKRRALLDQVE